MSKISVITTTHNRPEKLKEAMESVRNQSFTDWQMVVIDDHSTEDPKDIVDSFKDERIKYIRLESNFGNDTHPKNIGILASTSPYIAFLDDDCTYRPDHLQILINEMEKDPNLDGVYGDRYVHSKDFNGLGVASDYEPMLLLVRNYIDTSDVLIKRECIFDMGGFDERYKKYIDWNMWVRMAKANKKLKRVKSVITDYYLGEDSKSRRVEDTKDNRPAWDPIDCEVRLDYLGKKEPFKVAIFSLTHDRLEYSKKCFESLYATAGYEFSHFIVDNGSEDDTREWLMTQWKEHGFCNSVIFLLNDTNVGISKASNQALDAIGTGFDIIMKVDNDALFKNQGWLETMIKVYKSFPRYALSCYIEGLKDNPGGAARVDYMTIKDELIGYTKHLGGICHFVDAKAYKNFRWDEDSFLHGIQDMEFSQYLDRDGWYQGYLENWYCEHTEGTVGQHKRFPDYFKRRDEIEKVTKYEADK